MSNFDHHTQPQLLTLGEEFRGGHGGSFAGDQVCTAEEKDQVDVGLGPY